MEILYPRDWEKVSSFPSIIIHEANRNIHFRPLLLRQVDGVFSLVDSQFTIQYSQYGTIRQYTLKEPLEDGKYTMHFVESRFDRTLAQIGFFVNAELPTIGMGVNAIEILTTQIGESRFAVNGIGKSGTTWLFQMLGSLPRCRAIDMTANGLTGIDHEELLRVPERNVYHGHMRHGLEVMEALTNGNYRVVNIVRDIRDVVVSEYHHKFTMQRDLARPELAIRGPSYMLHRDNIMKWSSSLYAAPDAIGWAKSGDSVMVRYEDLVADTPGQMRRILTELGLNADSNVIAYLCEVNSFARQTGGRKPGQADNASPVRKGVPGAWKGDLAPDTVKWIEDTFSAYLDTFGYTASR